MSNTRASAAAVMFAAGVVALAGPAVNLRPGANGLEVVVRYITRAPRRNIVKAELFQAVVDLLHKPASVEAGARGA